MCSESLCSINPVAWHGALFTWRKRSLLLIILNTSFEQCVLGVLVLKMIRKMKPLWDDIWVDTKWQGTKQERIRGKRGLGRGGYREQRALRQEYVWWFGQGWADFSGKGQRAHILGFTSHTVFVATTHFCCYNTAVNADIERKGGSGPIKLCLWTLN